MVQRIRVLAVCRDNPDQVFGGDIVQLRKTLEHLERLGVESQVYSVSALPTCSYNNYDIVHFFHLPAITDQAIEWVHRNDLPYVISPIFWDTTELWFYHASRERMRWRLIVRAVGKRIGKLIYLRWQWLKRSKQPEWNRNRRILLSAQRVLPNSWIEARLIWAYFNLNQQWIKRVVVVYNGVNTSTFAGDIPTSTGVFDQEHLTDFILEVGRIESAKNQAGLLTALSKIPIPIVFAGQPSPLEPEYVKHCYMLSQQRGNVWFIERQPQTDLLPLYAAASAHVLPGWRETPGLASLEAAAAGCRIVSTSLGSAPEYFGNLAYYCKPDDIGSIRQAVLGVLKTPKSNVLRDKVLQNFTWEKAAQQTLSAYVAALQ